MNTMIPMAGQVPDLVSAIERGRAGYQAQLDRNNQNALRDYMRENGAGVMAGDQNALAGLAAYDPSAALGIQDQRLGMDATRLRMDATKQGMAIAAENLQMAREQVRQQAADRAAQMDANERAAAAAELERGLAMATQAQTPEQWDQIFSGFGEAGAAYVGQFAQKDMVIAGALGLKDALEMGKDEPGFRQATPEEAQQFGAPAGQFGPDGRFYPLNPPPSMAIQTADGTVIQQGPGVKPLTESQSKDNVYATRAMGALPDLDTYEGALTNLGQRATEMIPFGLGNFMQTPEYQVANNAGLEFGSAILRKDTGAAMTNEEIAINNRLFIPQPGDSDEVITRKRGARARAIAGIQSGMSPQQILSAELAASVGQTSGGTVDPAPPQGSPAAPAPSRMRYNPETDELEPF